MWLTRFHAKSSVSTNTMLGFEPDVVEAELPGAEVPVDDEVVFDDDGCPLLDDVHETTRTAALIAPTTVRIRFMVRYPIVKIHARLIRY